MKDYLKPCPFCGCRKIMVDYIASHQSIRCTKCHVSTPLYQDENIAVSAWNRRAEPQTTVIHAKNLAGISLFRCSNCGWSCSDTYTGDTPTYNFCQNCGAKMDMEEET